MLKIYVADKHHVLSLLYLTIQNRPIFDWISSQIINVIPSLYFHK